MNNAGNDRLSFDTWARDMSHVMTIAVEREILEEMSGYRENRANRKIAATDLAMKLPPQAEFLSFTRVEEK